MNWERRTGLWLTRVGCWLILFSLVVAAVHDLSPMARIALGLATVDSDSLVGAAHMFLILGAITLAAGVCLKKFEPEKKETQEEKGGK